MITKLIGSAKLVSGILGLLYRPLRRPPSRPKGVPVFEVHYKFGDVRGAHWPGPRIEVLCPDGQWRGFVWTTNTANPWCDDEYNGYSSKSPAEKARWLSDKFVGPTHFGRDAAMSENGVRSASYVGVWTLDPYCPEAHRRAGYPYHGEGWPNHDVKIDSSRACRLDEIRLLPCYEAC